MSKRLEQQHIGMLTPSTLSILHSITNIRIYKLFSGALNLQSQISMTGQAQDIYGDITSVFDIIRVFGTYCIWRAVENRLV